MLPKHLNCGILNQNFQILIGVLGVYKKYFSLTTDDGQVMDAPDIILLRKFHGSELPEIEGRGSFSL